MTTGVHTLGDVLQASEQYLAGRGVEHPRLAAELLAARLVRCPRLELTMHRDRALPESHLAAMRRGIKRVGDGEPVQYVLGEADFRGHVLAVDARCLIPRPETEELVEEVLRCEPLWASPPGIVDIGTGSGCISIALARERPGGARIGHDVSADALTLARENASRHGVGDAIVFTDHDLSDLLEPESVDAIVSNPPYIATADWERLPAHIRDHEPRMALDGGPDGLAVLRDIIEDAPILLKRGGWIFLEIGHDQAAAVTAMLREAGFDPVTCRKDAAGRDRIVTGRLAL